MNYRPRTALCAFLLVGLWGCKDTARHIDLALEDGTHVGGFLVSVEPDWLVLDRNASSADPGIMLVDYSIVDTVTIADHLSTSLRLQSSLVGAAAGGVGGYWAGEGYLPDSTRAADPKRNARATLGAITGVAIGGLLGYFLAAEVGSQDIVFPYPDDNDYNTISTYAKYPTGLPADLRVALDSGWEWKKSSQD